MELCMYRVKDSDVDFCIFYIPSFTKKIMQDLSNGWLFGCFTLNALSII